jgi:hypothetical protein
VIARTFAVETPCRDHLHQGRHQRLLAALVAREELGRKGPVAILGHPQLQRPHPRDERAWLVPVAIPGATFDPLVAGGVEVSGQLLLQDRLQSPLDDPPQEVGVIEQDRLCHLRQLATIVLGHRSLLLDRGSNSPTILEDGGQPCHPATLFTEL